MKTTLMSVSIAIVIVGSVGYWACNLRILKALEQELHIAIRSTTISAEAEQFLTFVPQLSDIALRAERRAMPLFKARYSNVAERAAEGITQAPTLAAEWVRRKRATDWTPIGAELRPNEIVSDRDLVQTIRSLQRTCDTGLRVQDHVADAINQLRIDASAVEGIHLLAQEVRITAQQTIELAHVARMASALKTEASRQVQAALVQVDKANGDLERFAEISALRQAVIDWEVAMNIILDSYRSVANPPSVGTPHQDAAIRALLRTESDNVRTIAEDILAHLTKARFTLLDAEEAERTALGRAHRRAGRLIDRGRQRVAESRIGHEVAISYKSLILSTKGFYDLLRIDSRNDFIRVARQFDNDMNELMREVREINQMEGWSLTGKNTFIETFVQREHGRHFGR